MNAQPTVEKGQRSCELSFREAHEAGCICAIVKLPLPPPIVERAREHLTKNCPYSFCFRDISFEYSDGVLTLRGRVPSFYLKQILQTLLRRLDGVEQIDNQVDVVSAASVAVLLAAELGVDQERLEARQDRCASVGGSPGVR